MTTRPRPKPAFPECAPQGRRAQWRGNDERKEKSNGRPGGGEAGRGDGREREGRVGGAARSGRAK
eukprot:424638-Prymnesium_polylepis.1